MRRRKENHERVVTVIRNERERSAIEVRTRKGNVKKEIVQRKNRNQGKRMLLEGNRWLSELLKL